MIPTVGDVVENGRGRRWAPLLSVALALSAAGDVPPRHQAFIDGLRKEGLPELAVDHLRRLADRPGLSAEDRATIQLELASGQALAADATADLSRREDLLNESRAGLKAFLDANARHPRAADARVQLATIDLREALLRLQQAQLPANAAQAGQLAEQSRAKLRSARDAYAAAATTYQADYKKMPLVIPEDEPDAATLRERKRNFFTRYIDARFQAAVCDYHVADTYLSLAGSNPLAGDAKRAADKAIAQAQEAFEKIYEEHRREGVGLFAYLWVARCMTARGELRRASGILDELSKHDSAELAGFQREVVLLQIELLARRREFARVVERGEVWLKENRRYARTAVGSGIQFEMAKAHAMLAEEARDSRDQTRNTVEANRLFDFIASYSNPYSGLARREQLRLATTSSKSPGGKNFTSLSSLAAAKLDQIKPDAPESERRTLAGEAIDLYRKALAAATIDDPADAVQQARLSLIYAYLQAGRDLEAAVLAEYLVRRLPQSQVAAQAGYLGVTAYARAFEQERQGNPSAAAGKLVADRLRSLVAAIAERSKGSSAADESLLTLGRLEYSLGNALAAAKALDAISRKSSVAIPAASVAGLAFREAIRQHAMRKDPDPQETSRLRKEAIERLRFASEGLKRQTSLSRDRFVNEATLGEVLFEAGELKQAKETLAPLVAAIEKNQAPADVGPELRLATLIAALQTTIALGDSAGAEGLVAQVGKQPGAEKSDAITLVLVQLVARLREQIATIPASEQSRRNELVAAFRKFLDGVAQRDVGQTPTSRVYLAESFLELGDSDHAVGLLEKAIAESEGRAEDDAVRSRARLLLARAQSRKGDHAAARATIDSLLKENLNARDVIVERGKILEDAGENKAAIAHWKWFVKRLSATRPRPPEFYEAMKRLLDGLQAFQGDERRARLEEAKGYCDFLLTTDPELPPAFRPAIEEIKVALDRELGG